jgi:hypothetical protein
MGAAAQGRESPFGLAIKCSLLASPQMHHRVPSHSYTWLSTKIRVQVRMAAGNGDGLQSPQPWDSAACVVASITASPEKNKSGLKIPPKTERLLRGQILQLQNRRYPLREKCFKPVTEMCQARAKSQQTL